MGRLKIGLTDHFVRKQFKMCKLNTKTFIKRGNNIILVFYWLHMSVG